MDRFSPSPIHVRTRSVANDDQYASNVPNSISSETPPPSSLAESGGEEERPRPPPPTTMTTRSSRRLEEAERVEEGMYMYSFLDYVQ